MRAWLGSVLIFCFSLLYAQHSEYLLTGKIVNEKNQALPFAGIRVEQTGKGTNANEEGFFELKLKEGDYQITIQYLGYKKQTENISLHSPKNILVVMHPEQITLSEITVKAGEDPAYAVIRNAIRFRKKHLREVNRQGYECSVYIKGVEKIDTFPEKLLGMKVSAEIQKNQVQKGILYLSETQSRFFYFPPSHRKEIIVASRVSGHSRAFSFNRYIPMQKNIYENTLDFYFVAHRPFISPISENALWFYKYKIHGTFYENGRLINKIELIPRSITDPCFNGFIYIEENSWRVHSFDFYVTKKARLNFIDTLRIKQMNVLIGDSVYFPASIQYLFNFNVLGFKGNGYFIASVSDYNFNTSDSLSSRFFSQEMVRFEKDAVKNDSAFWSVLRPIPLSEEEQRDYIRKDSIEKIKTSSRYLDSIDRKNNQFRVRKIFSGYDYQITKRNFHFHLDGIMDAGVQYNTVEGINFSLKTNMNKRRPDEITGWNWRNECRYGVSNRLWGLKSALDYADHPFTFRRYGIRAQYFVEPFNHRYAIPELVNTAYTLLAYRNYLKLYIKKSLGAYYYREMINGLYLNVTGSAEERIPLKNNHFVKWFDRPSYLTSNYPPAPWSDSISFPNHYALIFDIKLRYIFRQRYTTYPDHKYVWKSKYPVLHLEYKRAIPWGPFTADFDLLQCRIQDDWDLKYFGDFNGEVEWGKFLSNKKMFFMDYRHFAGNQTFLSGGWNHFRMLDYFRFSTDQYFVQAHGEYNMKGLMTSRLPLIRKLRADEIITMHYLYTPSLQHYFEISFGLELYYSVRVEYALSYAAFREKPGSQILIGLKFL